MADAAGNRKAGYSRAKPRVARCHDQLRS